jgi:putative MATE family efflux protein
LKSKKADADSSYLAKINRIYTLSSPIIVGMISQNILNLVDTAMVGKLSPIALAAVGLASISTFMTQSLLLGVSAGVQALVSREQGKGRYDSARILNPALTIIIIFGVLTSLCGELIAEPLMNLLNSDPLVVEAAIPYYKIRMLVSLFVAGSYAFRAYWSAIDKPIVYMKTLICVHICNIFLDYALIFGKFGLPRLEIRGAAIATATAIVFGYVLYHIWGFNEGLYQSGYLTKGGFFNRECLWKIVKISFFSGLEQLSVLASITVLFWIVNLISTRAVAALNVLNNIYLVLFLPGMGLGITLATLAGQALGAENIRHARKWGAYVVQYGVAIILLPMIFFIFNPELILKIFTDDAELISIASLPLQIQMIVMPFEIIAVVFRQALKNLGSARIVIQISLLTNWLVLLPLIWYFVKNHGLDLDGVRIYQGVYITIDALIFLYIWYKLPWYKSI